jgi:hypothetical protein
MGSVYKQPDKREDSSVTAGGRQVSEREYKGGEEGDSNGDKGLGKKRERATPCIYVTVTSAARMIKN